MNLGFQYGTKYIDFNVIFKKRKTMGIQIDSSGQVKVISPIGISEEDILRIVKTKAKWIIQKQYDIKSIKNDKINREAVNGESYMYLGRNYSLQLVDDKSIKEISVRLLQGKFIVTTNTRNQEKIKLALEKWYREKTLKRVRERVKYYKKYFKEEVTDIKVKEQKKRWASCTWNDELLFNWRCVMAPSNVLDYIVLHEMCHMVHKNHSKDFWNLVGEIMPDYISRKKWLKENGIKLDL